MKYKNILYFFIILIFGFFSKIAVIRHDLPSIFTNDLQHFFKAVSLNEVEGENFKKEWNEPSKYPLGLSFLYLMAFKNFSADGPDDLSESIIIARGCHIGLFILALVSILLLPLSQTMKLGSAALMSLSLILHQNITNLRIHSPTGVVVFISFLLIVMSFNIKKMSGFCFILTSFFVGYSASCFHTGVVALFPFVLAIYLKSKKENWDSKKIWGVFIFSVFVILGFCVYSYPQLRLKMSGDSEVDFLVQDHQEVQVNLKGFLSYFHEVVGVDPLLGFGYIFGLIFLFKSKKWQEPLWLITLSTLIPYQLIMGLFENNAPRRTSFAIPLISLVACYGWKNFIIYRKKVSVLFLTVLAVLSFISIFRFNYLINRDSRVLAHKFVYENLDEKNQIIADHLGPDITMPYKGFANKNYVYFNTRNFLPYLNQTYDENEKFREFLESNNLSVDSFNDPRTYPKIMSLLGFKYYIRNGIWQTYREHLNTDAVVEQSQLVAQWNPNLKHYVLAGVESHWLFWRIWFVDYGGPSLEIYKLF